VRYFYCQRPIGSSGHITLLEREVVSRSITAISPAKKPSPRATAACRTENARRNAAASLARAHDIFLSVINLALWSYNLFVFLLLRVLPIYFDKIKTPPVDMAYTVVPIPKTNAN